MAPAFSTVRTALHSVLKGRLRHSAFTNIRRDFTNSNVQLPKPSFALPVTPFFSTCIPTSYALQRPFFAQFNFVKQLRSYMTKAPTTGGKVKRAAKKVEASKQKPMQLKTKSTEKKGSDKRLNTRTTPKKASPTTPSNNTKEDEFLAKFLRESAKHNAPRKVTVLPGEDYSGYHSKAETIFSMPCKFVKSCSSMDNLPEGKLPEVAFVGRSNVGKSSLINALLSKHTLVRTSKRPGATQLLNYFLVGDQLHIVDMPGYGYAKVPVDLKRKWVKLMKSFLSQRPNLRMTYLLMDARREGELKDSDIDFVTLLQSNNVPYQIVMTKVDRVSESKLNEYALRILNHEFVENPDNKPIIFTSSKHGYGLDYLKASIVKAISNPPLRTPAGITECITPETVQKESHDQNSDAGNKKAKMDSAAQKTKTKQEDKKNQGGKGGAEDGKHKKAKAEGDTANKQKEKPVSSTNPYVFTPHIVESHKRSEKHLKSLKKINRHKTHVRVFKS